MINKTEHFSKRVVVSAPGKIHLMGEHAVVHGTPALLSAITRRLVATVSPNSTGLTIQSDNGTKLIKEALHVVCDRFKMEKNQNITLSVTSSIPTGRHAGSSAAVAVAVVGALLYYLKKIWNPDLINKLAYEVERIQHGTPSGGDNSICTYGGFIWFRKELEFLKTIWQIPFRPAKELSSLYLIDTGKPKENTGEMVMHVHTFVKNNPSKARKAFWDNEKATKDVAISLKNGNETMLIDAVKRGSRSLVEMGVVSSMAQNLISSVERAGGAAKILGGGGKSGPVGFILCYHNKRSRLEEIASKYHCQLSDVSLGEEGVRLESGRR